MPEGHTIHGLARDHTRLLARRTLSASSPQGRFAAGASRLDGRRIERIDPYGKHLFYKRNTCVRCGSPIDWFALAGRTCYACPVCQT